MKAVIGLLSAIGPLLPFVRICLEATTGLISTQELSIVKLIIASLVYHEASLIQLQRKYKTLPGLQLNPYLSNAQSSRMIAHDLRNIPSAKMELPIQSHNK